MVVSGDAVDVGVVDIDVVRASRVLGAECGAHRQEGLLGRCRGVAGRDVRPTCRRRKGRNLVTDVEVRGAGLLCCVQRRGEDAAGREEVREIDGRPGDVRRAATDPLDLGDLLASPLCGIRDGVGLEDIGGREARPAAECVTGPKEGVVGRAVLTRVRPGGHRVPADTGVRREPLGHAVVTADPLGHERGVGRHRPLRGVGLHEVRTHAVRGEQDRLVGARLAVGRLGSRHGRRNDR